MNLKPQIIEQDGKPAFVVLPVKEWRQIQEALEDLEDRRLYDEAKAAGGETYPADLVHAILDGANPVKAFREWRGLTQVELAGRAGIATLYLSQIENGRRTGSAKVLRALARGLEVGLDLIVGAPTDEGAKKPNATGTRRRAGRRARP